VLMEGLSVGAPAVLGRGGRAAGRGRFTPRLPPRAGRRGAPRCPSRSSSRRARSTCGGWGGVDAVGVKAGRQEGRGERPLFPSAGRTTIVGCDLGRQLGWRRREAEWQAGGGEGRYSRLERQPTTSRHGFLSLSMSVVVGAGEGADLRWRVIGYMFTFGRRCIPTRFGR
jgi:hypothetical protein